MENTQVGLPALVFGSSLFSILSGKLLRTQNTTVTAAGITVFVSSTRLKAFVYGEALNAIPSYEQ